MADGRYLTVDDFKQWARDEVQADDELIGAAILAAQQQLDNACARRFAVASGSSARVYAPDLSDILIIDDCTAISSVVENGSTLAGTVYQAEPLNNLSPGGETVPYNKIRRLSGCWYRNGGKATITVTATWGWAAVPYQIVEACKIVTKANIEVRDARFGLAAVLENGVGVSPREVTTVKQAIAQYSGIRAVMVA